MRISELLASLTEAGLSVGDNPVVVTDQYGAEYPITEINSETGDIFIILEAPDA